jgi:hypothetical protein
MIWDIQYWVNNVATDRHATSCSGETYKVRDACMAASQQLQGVARVRLRRTARPILLARKEKYVILSAISASPEKLTDVQETLKYLSQPREKASQSYASDMQDCIGVTSEPRPVPIGFTVMSIWHRQQYDHQLLEKASVPQVWSLV